MKKQLIYLLLLALVTIMASILRFKHLDRRVMHHDEANQAVKSGLLLESGCYEYDSQEHHGPTLYYLSLPGMMLKAGKDFASVDESTLRMLPAIFGVALVLLFFFMRNAVGWPAALIGALFTAISPIFVFYSRFYIQEMLLVFFSFATLIFLWHYFLTGQGRWAILTGVMLGLMHATKETCVIAYASMSVAFLVYLPGLRERKGILKWRHLIWGVAAAILVSVLLFASFFSNMRGPIDSIMAFSTYLKRGGGESEHIYPCFHYFKMLFWEKRGGIVWTEAVILVLALVGFIAAVTRRGIDKMDIHFVQFAALYSIVMAILYSFIPYKTPWCALSFYNGFIIMAGIGAVSLFNVIRHIVPRLVIAVFIAGASFALVRQACLAVFRYSSDSRNPYVYVHTVSDYLNLVNRVNDLSRIHADGKNMLVVVVAGPEEQWPLPWYLRGYENVGYWQSIDDVPEALLKQVPVVVASAENDLSSVRALRKYQSEYYGLRPDVLLNVYIEPELWRSFIDSRR